MGMVVQHNMNAINAYNKLNVNVAGMKKSSEKLSSGYRINRAGDDAAGLAVSEKMRSQIKGLNQAIRNSQDGINMIQTFEGAAQETHSILQRMKELATQSANGTYDNPTDRAAMQLEFDQLNDELNQIADTDFNGTIVLNGGEMADGLKADNMDGGEFNYANFAKQQAEEAAKAPLDLYAQKDYTGDRATGGKVPELDDSGYVSGDTAPTATSAGSGKLWAQAKTDGYTAAEKADHINIKYTISGVDADGKVTGYTGEYVDDNGKTIMAYGVTPTLTTNGGVKDETTGANVVMDTIGAKAGDFVIVKYSRPAGTPQEPTNIGFLDSTKEGTGIQSTGDAINGDAKKTTIELGDDVTNANWVAGNATATSLQTAIEKLDGSQLKLDVTINTAGDDYANGSPVVKFTEAGGSEATLVVGATVGWGVTATPTKTTNEIELTYNGIKVAKVTVGGIDIVEAIKSKTGSITMKIDVDGYRKTGADGLNASLMKDPSTVVDRSVSEANAFKHSTARMTYAKNIILQTGARTKDAVNFSFNYNADKTADMGELENNLNLSAREGGLETANLSLATQEDANHAIDQIDKAINKTSMVRATFGAIQNRLEHKITNLTTTSENLTEAESAIRDTDMASEMMNYTKFNILQQAAQSMLAQANQQPQSILQLLG